MRAARRTGVSGPAPSATVDPATAADAEELAEVAAVTFPLACPPTVGPDDIAACIAENLSAARFADYLADPDRRVLTARAGGRIIGYSMLIRGVGADPDIAGSVPQRPAVELSKMYVLPGHHGAGVAAALMEAALRWAGQDGAAAVWLGVNARNLRAQRFYAKHGFAVSGTRRFRLGGHLEDDVVMVRPL